jgi:hypothetical protein
MVGSGWRALSTLWPTSYAFFVLFEPATKGLWPLAKPAPQQQRFDANIFIQIWPVNAGALDNKMVTFGDGP